ncbi:MAG: filamentous hemagglutinin N-terminal domain-containing protein [Gloeocapsa sp. UFS-A4-WI-NPMV-4B04]|jgi:filamentous hemagglutinin family protein|nr:filamentous hemagglutinin N-terminal domain-containing protein [Gloeocapsa sp. UFS-A4-WI-NPMV-4B04]
MQTIPIWFVKSSILFFAAFPTCTLAQIVPDATLPTNSSITTEGSNTIIIEGTKAGSNLFHSFEQFSVPTGGTAYFNNALDIQNIFSRVTGASISNIDGLVRANGTANLFLLNPNGIIFGSNARLNIGGSFLASTASSLNFADGTQFNATAPQTAPLLTIDRPVGLQFGSNSGRILVQGSGAIRNNSGLLLNREAGLSVQLSATLALVGSGVALEGGILATEGGRIELGSVANPSLVRITPIDKGWALDYSEAQSFENIQLSQQAAVDASGVGGGNVQVQGRQIALINGAQIESSTVGSHPGGTLSVTASESVELIGRSANNQFSSALGTSAYPGAIGNAGSLSIKTGRLSVRDGAQVGSVTSGTGSAGALTINADSVELVGTSSDGRFPTSLSTSSRPGATGNGGNLTIQTRRVSIRDGAQIQASTFGSGLAGTLAINASESVELIGTTADRRFPTTLNTAVQRGATGTGGNLTIKTGRLSVRDGAQIGSATAGTGAAGALTVKADLVELIGTAPGSLRPSALSARTTSIGNAGNLRIKTGRLILQDGATVTVSSEGLGKAGQLEVQAGSVILDNQAKLVAATNSGEDGNIALEVQDLLLLRRNSQISTEARGTANGGDITVDAGILIALENSDITANAFEGQGGNIQINIQDIFRSPDSDITATSTLGINGTVQINTLLVNPSNGLVDLPEQLVDISKLIAQGCSGSTGNVGSGTGRFIIMGRGGLPPQPGDSLQAEARVINGNRLEAVKEQTSVVQNTTPVNPSSPSQLIEAQAFVRNGQGEMVLVAQPSNATPENFSSTQETCYAP